MEKLSLIAIVVPGSDYKIIIIIISKKHLVCLVSCPLVYGLTLCS
jgi:hypothetical protein